MRLLYKTGPMESLRKWFYKPKRDDRSLLAQFFFADDALNMVAAELDSFDGRKDPERCTTLVNQLRHAQVWTLDPGTANSSSMAVPLKRNS
ncbi:unnamed protein product [Plutella xylostella]|uniref:(diamondback moth) hypothetical protein n=1 Tax=Plutella xylostella TaxID=51655 RepID=A0A8S4G528_PLUXY|nr:unnamed protein product [Plutella xylostella]